MYSYLSLILFVMTGLVPQPELNLEITGIREIRGTIVVAVYDKPASFLSEEVVMGDEFVVESTVVKGKLRLPYGKYAISVYHDVNADQELNTKIFGIPNEPVGFSNNVRGNFGPPDFEDACILFKENHQTISINLSKH